LYLSRQNRTTQARSQVLKFGGAKYILGGQVFITRLKQIFLETTQFGG